MQETSAAAGPVAPVRAPVAPVRAPVAPVRAPVAPAARVVRTRSPLARLSPSHPRSVAPRRRSASPSPSPLWGSLRGTSLERRGGVPRGAGGRVGPGTSIPGVLGAIRTRVSFSRVSVRPPPFLARPPPLCGHHQSNYGINILGINKKALAASLPTPPPN